MERRKWKGVVPCGWLPIVAFDCGFLCVFAVEGRRNTGMPTSVVVRMKRFRLTAYLSFMLRRRGSEQSRESSVRIGVAK